MRLILEVDLNDPRHNTAGNALAAMKAIVTAMEQQIPSNADLRELPERYKNEEYLILAEGVGQQADGDRDAKVAATRPCTLRLKVDAEPFDNVCRSAAQAERANSGLSMTTAPVPSGATHALGLKIRRGE